MLGFQPEEITPTVEFFKQLVHPTDLPDVISKLMEHIEGRSPTYKSEHRLRNKAGEWIWVLDQGSATAWGKNGVATRVSGVVVNINERKIKEREVHELSVQAQEANRAKSEFLATMSHEIRTPLNAISGFTQLLGLNENLSTDEREYINKVLTSTEGLLKIINSVLDLSKVEAGKVEIEIAPYPLTALLDDVAILKSHAMKRGIEFTISNSAVPGFDEINIDTLRLKQCLVNVVGNSIKFTKDNGFVSLVSSFEMQDDKRIFVRFDIIDNGIGIAADNLSRIFEPFMQAESSTTRRFGGTGLGLPFTKKIIELMGGSVDVHSEENEYTIFTLKVPTHLDKETFDKKIKLATTFNRIT
jgi:PAS domain S-box-containing protein